MQTHATGSDGQQRRFFIAAGTALYDRLAEDDWLGSVPGDVERLAGLFCGQLGYTRVLAELGDNPTSQQLRGTLSDWLTDPARRADDLVVVYYSGHGVTRGGRHYLLTRDSIERNLAGTALATEEFAWMLGEDSPVQQLLVIIDTCYAGRGMQDLGRVAAQLAEVRAGAETASSGLWFLAAARPRDEADEGVFAEALVAAVSQPRTGLTQPYVSLDTLVNAINEVFAQRALAQRARLGAADAGGQAPFIPNLGYDPGAPVGLDLESLGRLRQAREDFTAHWLPRARGVALASDPGWYFSGRTRVLRELVGWLSDPDVDHRARVITGGPGSGKSAVLARLVTLADPQTRPNARLQQAPAGTVSPEGGIDVAVHARNKTLAEVVAALAAGIGANAATPEELLEALAARPRRRVVVIDALDEASAPEELADRLLRPLLDQAPRSGLRLLVGTRWPLVRALGPRTVMVDLDDPAYLELGDLASYVTQVLLAEQEPGVATPYRGRRDLAEQVAWAVARRASPTFLIARLVARSFVTADEVVDVSAVDWRERLPASVGHAFDAYLERFGADERRVRDLLTPLAWAEGAGLPWEQLWAPLARALAGKDQYSDDDIGWLHDAAAAYLVESREGGRSVYRLYHQALAEHLRDQTRQVELQGRIARVLIACTPTGADGRPDWLATHPYIRTHLVIHAGEAGRLDELLEDPLFLVAADLERVLQVLNRVPVKAQPISRLYRRVAHHLAAADPRTRAAILRDAAMRDEPALVAALAFHFEPAWNTLWTDTRTAFHQTLTGHRMPNALAVARLQDGRTLLASGGKDAIRVWDATTGLPVKEFAGHTNGPVTALAFTVAADGRVLLASAGYDDIVRVWDVDHDELVAELRGHTRVPTGLVWIPGQEGLPQLVSASMDGTMRWWDLDAREERHVLAADRAGVVALAAVVTPQDGLLLAGAGRSTTTVILLDPISGSPVGALPDHSWTVRTLATCERPDGRTILVSGADDRRARFWDVTSPADIEMIAQIDLNEIHPLTVFTRPDGRTVLATEMPRSEGVLSPIGVYGLNGDLITRLEGHTGRLDALVSVELSDGRVLLASAATDDTVRLWDLTDSASVKAATNEMLGPIAVIEDAEHGATVIVGGNDGSLYYRNMMTGAARATQRAHNARIRSVTSTLWRDGSDVLVTVSADGDDSEIGIWKPATAGPEPVTRYPVSTSAFCSRPAFLIDIEGRHLMVTDGAESLGSGLVLRFTDTDTRHEWRQTVLGGASLTAVASTTLLNGDTVIALGDHRGAIRLWNLTTETIDLHVTIPTLFYGVHSLAFLHLPDGRTWLIATSNAAYIWDLSTGRQEHTLNAHTDSLTGEAITTLADGSPILITGSKDCTVRVWDALSGQLLVAVPLDDAVRDVAALGPLVAVSAARGMSAIDISASLPPAERAVIRQRPSAEPHANEESLKESANADSLRAMTSLAMLLRRQGDGSGADAWLAKAAGRNEPQAAFVTGRSYLMSGNTAKAKWWLRRAAEHGSAYAALHLAIMLTELGENQEAERFAHIAADSNHVDGMCLLGWLAGRRGDTAQEEMWHRRAYEGGSIESAYSLGVLLEARGDAQEAEELLEFAANANHTEAISRLLELDE